MIRLFIVLLLFSSGCRTVPTKASCTNVRCMPEEHDVRYWRN